MLAALESAEPAEPERPAGIPESGFWNPSVGKWEVSQVGADGVRDGERLYYRADGSLFSRTRFVAGVEHGPFAIYHPDGSVAREGRFIAGRIEGLVKAYRAGDGRGESLRACCVPPKAARLDLRYRAGDLLLEVFYDDEGREILSDGSPSPPRPPGLPELAAFDEARGGWALRSPELDRLWSSDGALLEEDARPAGGPRVLRVYDGAGAISAEQHFDAGDRRDGPFFRRVGADEPAPYADARIRQERGSFDHGQAVGTWSFLDGDGAVVRTVERGVAFRAALAGESPAFAPSRQDVDDGAPGAPSWTLAGTLAGQGRVREALCVAARAAVRDGDRARLVGFIAEHRMALPPEVEAERGEALARSSDVDVAGVLDGLMQGTDAASAFRALAGVLPGASAAAAELVEAALLLAPERRMTRLTRALIRVQRGDEAGARADAAAVETASPGAAEGLLAYMRVVFRPFAFQPAEESLDHDADSAAEMPVEIGQSLEAIRHAAGVYATRLGAARDAIRALLGGASEPEWLPPDVSALLPDGPVALRCERIACEPEDEAAEGEWISIDEQLATDGVGVPALLALARADHAALGWLCWSAGLDRVALPEALEPPDTLTAGMRLIVKRAWRVNDRLTTGGLLALTNNVPGFEWQGMDIDLVPPHLLDMVGAEYLAVRSMFLWLASPDAVSPFQDDIREA